MRRWLEALTQDLGYALRSFRRSPMSVLVALLSLTLGIGATSAIFSVVYGVLISPYPYAKPDEIWAPQARATDGRGGHTYALDELPRLAALPAFADVMATSYESVLMTGEFAPESFGGVLMSGNAFNFLGVPPVTGRTIQPSDIRSDGQAEPVVVLSHKLWLRLFEGSPSAVGRTLRLNGVPHTIVGVMPPRFGWYGNDGFWLPLSPIRKDLQFINPIARLAPGATKEIAEQQLAALHKQLAAERPATFPAQGFTTLLHNYLDVTVASGEMRTSLRLLLGAVAFLLLIACANVANLQLARGTTRAREMAVRMSIGADRRRLVRQLLTENVLLAIAGGVAGVVFAFVAIRSIVALMPEFYVPNESRVEINVPVLLFALGISVLTGIVFGLAPALQTSKPEVTDALKAARSTGGASEGRRSRSLLVVIEVALSVVLLAGAALTVRTFLVLQNMDAGVDPDRVLVMGVPLQPAKYDTLDKRNRFIQELIERVGALPGVEAVGDRPAVRRGAVTVHHRRSHARRLEADRRQPGGRRPSARVRHSAARRPDVRRRRGAARRSRRRDQRGGGEAVAGGRESDRRAAAARPAGTRAGANVRRHLAPAGGHDRRHRRQHAERRPARRADAGRDRPLHRRRDPQPHARGAHGG